jgi:chemotaxis protein MotB
VKFSPPFHRTAIAFAAIVQEVVMRTIPVSFLLPLFITSVGCVTQGTYDALKAEQDKTVASLNECTKTRDQTREALATEEAKAKAMAEKMTELQAALGSTKEQLGSTVKAKSALEAALEELKKRKAEAEARIAEFKGLLDKFKALIDAGKLKVRIREGKMVVELATDILFKSGSATLSKDGKAAIEEVTDLLKTIPNRQFQIEGYTDNARIKTPTFTNWDLGAARAITVLKTMIAAGMPPDRISAATYGETKPAKPNDSPEDKAANRRIEIVVVPDLSSLPGFDELQRAAAE